MQRRFYGLSPMEVKRIAYELAEQLQLKHHFNQDKKMAGKDWLSSFMARYLDISIRKPEVTSLSRATGFNKIEISKFFDLICNLIGQNNLQASQIYNYDDTSVSTVHTPRKVLAKKGEKQVMRIVSAKRGTNITMGSLFHLFICFPQQCMQLHFMKGCSPGSVGFANGLGW